jgi:hypothetical protein
MLCCARPGYDVDLANRPEAALAKAPEADVMLCDSVVAGDKHGSVAQQRGVATRG